MAYEVGLDAMNIARRKLFLKIIGTFVSLVSYMREIILYSLLCTIIDCHPILAILKFDDETNGL